ncbi:lichenan operon transcriptional antiterminator [Virgibacillus halotolerans]|uniref:BglG family transcription antiterminator n=1 Tax=Virgibacillus halotolerans TaxID=1071053 RepID=UPI00196154DF|nr:PRD domain-containing protein [Virgibacillus halotolerans]MBM7599031.1 lichenan operon transcriptional antiterminator [Virgibacillus halotolerans]
MELNKKHLEIVEVLMSENVSAEKLSHLMKISQRTLSNYVGQINDYFEGTSNIIKEYHILSILIYDEERFLDRLSVLRQEMNSNEEELKDRPDAVFHHLLEHKQRTIDDIAEALYLSKSVVNNIVRDLKVKLQSYPLNIKGTQNVGLRLEGNEFTIRKVIIEQFPTHYQSVFIPEKIEQHLSNLKKKFTLDESSFSRLRLAVQVTLSRLNDGHLIEEELDIDRQVFESADFKSFQPLKEEIAHNYPIKNSNQEIFLIVLQLLGRRASIIDEMINEREHSMLERIIKQTIEDINYYYTIKIDEAMFSKDIQLHIKYLINRLLFDVKVNNTLVDNVQQRFPFAYELSSVLAENIKKEINMDVPINELDFLSLYFSVYLEQLEQQIREIQSVAIITNGGLSTSKLLKVNLQRIFGNHIEIVVFNEDALENDEIKHFDLIISTIWTSRLFNKVIYIENILDTQLMKLKIEQFLVYKDVRNKKLFNQSVIVDFTEEKDFYHIDQSSDYQEVIRFLSEELAREGKVDNTFTERIIAREHAKSTVTGKLGFPHVSHNQHGIFVKIALINTPLDDYQDVKIVILLATPDQAGNEAALIRLYEEVLAITTNSYLLNKVTKDTNYASFAHILNKEMRK